MEVKTEMTKPGGDEDCRAILDDSETIDDHDKKQLKRPRSSCEEEKLHPLQVANNAFTPSGMPEVIPTGKEDLFEQNQAELAVEMPEKKAKKADVSEAVMVNEIQKTTTEQKEAKMTTMTTHKNAETQTDELTNTTSRGTSPCNYFDLTEEDIRAAFHYYPNMF